jgi:hypothetical protein
MRYGGQPSAADLAKAAPSDGVGDHSHDGLAAHGHGAPSFSDAQVAYLASKGFHVERHHGQVFGDHGRPVLASVVAAKLNDARDKGLLKSGGPLADSLVNVGAGHSSGSQLVSGPGETAVSVQYVDLRGG